MSDEFRLTLDHTRPFVAVSSGKSTVFRTGTQRSEHPVFENKAAPCRVSCPIGIDIPAAFSLASKGNWKGALELYLEENPLPGVCGRVCYHPCEAQCNRGKFDEPVNIRGLERFLSDQGGKGIFKRPRLRSKKKIAVVGSGPAGLSNAYHMARLGYSITLFETRRELGGMLRYGIPAYRLPRSVLDREIERVLSLGITVRTGQTVGGTLSWEELASFEAVFLAFGLQGSRSIPALEHAGEAVVSGIDFLSKPARKSFERASEKTLIVGGGNVAMDVARTLLRLRRGRGENILLISPESSESMPALPEEVREAEEEGLTIVTGFAPLKLRVAGVKSLSVDFMKAKVMKEPSGFLRIGRVGREIRTYRAQSVIVAVGQVMAPVRLPSGMEALEGRIKVDAFGRTNHPKFFAGGDVSGGKSFVADAIAGGKMAALSMACYLENKPVEDEFSRLRIGTGRSFSFQRFLNPQSRRGDLSKTVFFEQVNLLFFTKAARGESKKRNALVRSQRFQEVSSGMEPSAADRELLRCFKCGTCTECDTCMDFCPDVSLSKNAPWKGYAFDQDHCKGCGVCAVACPRSVIDMAREAT